MAKYILDSFREENVFGKLYAASALVAVLAHVFPWVQISTDFGSHIVNKETGEPLMNFANSPVVKIMPGYDIFYGMATLIILAVSLACFAYTLISEDKIMRRNLDLFARLAAAASVIVLAIFWLKLGDQQSGNEILSVNLHVVTLWGLFATFAACLLMAVFSFLRTPREIAAH